MIEKEAYDKAIKVLELCSTPLGFFAAFPGYKGVWARDSMITSLGASLLGEKFHETFKHSLITLVKNQSKHGQIPNAIMFDKKPPKPEYKSIDSTLWFLIGSHIYKERYKDASLFKKQKTNINDALTWLSYQDTGEDGMLEQQPTSDWQDAFPHRYGHTINTQALYYKVLKLEKKNKEAKLLYDVVNKDKEDSLWNGNFYYSYRWKNHNKYKEIGEWFDSLGNLLAVVFDLSSPSQSDMILSHIDKNEINKPFPVKAMYPPISRESPYWHDYFDDANARTPFHYLNAGIWTFIGGFYILALIKRGKFEQASFYLKKIAEANMKLNGNFSEWLDGKTGEASADGGNQAWNAGMYVLAYESLRKKKVLLP